MTDDESINELAEVKREEAFQAAPFHWKEIELKPLSIGREGDWLMHCRRIGLPSLHEVINTGEGFLGMAQRMLWFCAHEPRVWLAVWMKGGEAAPIILETMITTWTDKHVQPGEQIAVLKMALEIYDRSRATQARRNTEDDEDAGEGHGLATALNTSASLARPSTAPVPISPSNTNSPKRKVGRSRIPTVAPRARPTNGRKMSRKKKGNSGRA